MKTATVVLADDHELVRLGVRLLFQPVPEFQVVAEAENGAETVDLVERWRPDILIVDIAMPRLDGIAVTRQVRQRCPGTRVVILSMHDEEFRVLEALREGALAYVLKRAVAQDLVHAVRAALDGRHYLSAPLSARALEDYATRAAGRPLDAYHTLTAREREVFHLLAQGLTHAGIAARLGISPHTVNTHVERLMQKLDLRTSREIVRYAVEHGLTGS